MSQLEQLNQAKELLEQKPEAFSQVTQMIIQIVNATSDLSTQQWCTNYFYEFTSPFKKQITMFQKQDVCNDLIPTLRRMSSITDVVIIKNIILTMTNLYEAVFDLVAKTSNKFLWDEFTQLKNFIVIQWNTTFPLEPTNNREIDESRPVGVKLAIVKFISKIIIIQTPAASSVSNDPRRSKSAAANTNTNEICISNISDSHAVISKNVLDAEAQGLLDLLINYLNDEEYLFPQKFISILNALIIILQKRYQLLQSKILNGILNFKLDSKYQLSNDSNLKFRLSKRYVDRYVKNLLNYCSRANIITQSNPLSAKAQKWVTQIDTRMIEQKKRGILTDLDNYDQPSRKKVKLESSTTPISKSSTPNPAMVSEDNSYASLYRLIDSNNDLSKFDASQLPPQLLSNLAIATLLNTDTQKLISALSIVSARYADLINKTPPPTAQIGGSVPPPPPPPAAKQEVIDDTDKDDADNNQILSQNDQDDPNLETTYILPAPKSLSFEDKKAHIKLVIENFFKVSTYKVEDQTPNTTQGQEPIDNTLKINKIAISKWTKNSWLVLLTRLATRGLAVSGSSEEEVEELGDIVRESLFQYFLENIHERIDIIIEWLNEEWFAEFNKNSEIDEKEEKESSIDSKIPIYLKWTEKILDTVIPFLEANDRKIFIRLLSDLPYLNNELVLKLKSLCTDPERSTLGFQSLQFLIMFKPPVKQGCIDILKDLYESNEDLKDTTKSLLKKYVPEEFKDKE